MRERGQKTLGKKDSVFQRSIASGERRHEKTPALPFPSWVFLAALAPWAAAVTSSITSLQGLSALGGTAGLSLIVMIVLISACTYEARETPLRWLCLVIIGIAVVVVPVTGSVQVLDTYDLPKQSVSTILMVSLLLCWATSRVVDDHVPRPLYRPLAILSVLFMVASLLSLFRAVNVTLGLFQAGRLLLSIGTLVAIHDLADTPDRARRLLSLAGFTALVVACLAAYQSTGGEIPGFPQVAKPAATFGNKNMATEYMVLLYPLLLALILWAGNRVLALAGAVATVLMTYVLSIARTRADWVASVVVLIVLAIAWLFYRSLRLKGLDQDERCFWWTTMRHRQILCVVALVSGLCLSWIVPWMLKSAGVQNAATLDTSAIQSDLDPSRGSTQWRVTAWVNTLCMVKDHPLLGVGANNWQLVYPLYHRAWRSDQSFDTRTQATTLHNDFLQYWAETGLLGLIAFVGLFIVAIRALTVHARSLTEPWGPIGVATGAGVLAAGADCFFSFPFQLAAPTLIFWFLLALCHRAACEPTVAPARTRPGPIDPETSVRPGKGISLALLGSVALGGLFLAYWAAADLAGSWHMRIAYALSGKNRWMESSQEFLRSVEASPYVYNPYLLLGRSYFQIGQMPRAVAANHLASVYHPNHCNIYYNLANCLRELGRPDDAVKAFDRCLGLYPDNADAWNNRGNILRAMGQTDKALESFAKASALNPRLQEAVLNQGSILLDTGRITEGRALFARVLAVHPKFARARQALGNAALKTGDLVGAISQFEEAVAIDPGYVEALNNLGAAYWQKGDATRAQLTFERAISIRHNFAPSYFGLADVFFRQGKRQECLTAYQQFLAYWPARDNNWRVATQRVAQLKGSK